MFHIKGVPKTWLIKMRVQRDSPVLRREVFQRPRVSLAKVGHGHIEAGGREHVADLCLVKSFGRWQTQGNHRRRYRASGVRVIQAREMFREGGIVLLYFKGANPPCCISIHKAKVLWNVHLFELRAEAEDVVHDHEGLGARPCGGVCEKKAAV